MKLNEIKPNPDNPRTASKEDIDKLKNSITDLPKMMRLRPIVVNKDNIIVGGNQRYNALKALGKTEIPDDWVTKADDFTEEELKRFVVQDNVSSGAWDWDVLANQYELEDLDAWGVELPESLLPGESEVEEDEAPEVSSEPPISKLGEIYQLGRHKIMCADSTVKENVDLLMGGVKADMVFTDPPYGINLDTDYKGMPSRWNDKETYRNKFTKVEGDAEQVDMAFLQDIECKEMFLFGADYYAYSLPKSGADGTWYVWDKREDEDGKSYDKMMTAPFEMCWGKKKRGKKFIRMRWAGFMSSDNAEGERPIGRVHPTQKPVALASWFIKQFSEKNWNILDLFLGAGFTVLACEQTDRICYGMELDPKYVDVIRKRYAKFTAPNNELPENWEELTPAIERELSEANG